MPDFRRPLIHQLMKAIEDLMIAPAAESGKARATLRAALEECDDQDLSSTEAVAKQRWLLSLNRRDAEIAGGPTSLTM